MNELRRLSVVIPARDEEGCIASTVHHLNLELRLRGVPHEIVVVDDPVSAVGKVNVVTPELKQTFRILEGGLDCRDVIEPLLHGLSRV